MPPTNDVLATATAAFAVATWIVPPAIYFLRARAKFSLVAVGRVIALFVQTACLSVVTLVLAISTLVFSQAPGWGWFGLAAIGVYWFVIVIFLLIGDHTARRRQREMGRNLDQP